MNPINEEKIHQALQNLTNWSFDENKISKKFEFKNFKESLAVIVSVGLEAEIHGHHPHIDNLYNRVTIKLQTHDAGDKVTEKDIDLANAIESII